MSVTSRRRCRLSDVSLGGIPRSGGLPKCPGGDPKCPWGGSQKWRDPKKGIPKSRGCPGAGFWERGDPKFGTPIFWDPLILGPLYFGIPLFWDPSILGSLHFGTPPSLGSPHFGLWCRPSRPTSLQYNVPPWPNSPSNVHILGANEVIYYHFAPQAKNIRHIMSYSVQFWRRSAKIFSSKMSL